MNRSTDSVFIVYGRMNPPTIGHKALIDKMLQMARSKHADAYVVVSHTQDAKKNPLLPTEKVEILKQMYPDESKVQILATSATEPMITNVLKKLQESGYLNMSLVVGSDRVADFQFLKKQFPDLQIVSGGERDPDSNSGNLVASMSATKMRNAALSGNRRTFRSGTNASILNSQVNTIMRKIRNRMTAKNKKRGGRRTRKQ